MQTKSWAYLEGVKNELFQRTMSKSTRIYHQCKSVSKTVCILGYLTREQLYAWIKNENISKKSRKNFY